MILFTEIDKALKMFSVGGCLPWRCPLSLVLHAVDKVTFRGAYVGPFEPPRPTLF